MDEITQPMSKDKRLKQIGGVVMLLAVMLVVSFSMGIYFERHILDGEEDWSQSPSQPGGSNARNPQPPQSNRQPQLPPGLTEPPQVIGNLAHIEADAFEIITQQGPRPVLFSGETSFRDHKGNTIAPGDLQQGFILAVYGEPNSDRQNLLATEVVLLPPPPNQPQQNN